MPSKMSKAADTVQPLSTIRRKRWSRVGGGAWNAVPRRDFTQPFGGSFERFGFTTIWSDIFGRANVRDTADKTRGAYLKFYRLHRLAV